MEGNNTIISAPTGSGKTIVALMIIQQQLKLCRDLPLSQKILFLACNVRLVNQQVQVLKDYLPSRIRIESMTSEDAKEISFQDLFENNDIMVITAQIFLNSLENKRVGIDRVSLLLFDECHHTDKGHIYMKIMTRYLFMKKRSSGDVRKLPLVVGLTASIGIGSGGNLAETVDHVVKMCGHLDAKFLVSVKDNKDELQTYCNSPDLTFLDVPKKSVESDIFIKVCT